MAWPIPCRRAKSPECGVPTYPLANGHGDIIGNTDAAGTFTANPVTDEFGVGDVPASRLGYLGAHERFATGGSLKLVRMGVRLYDPKLGRFLQVDPVEGGCSNDYAYVHGDPVNAWDVTGEFACPKWLQGAAHDTSIGGLINDGVRWLGDQWTKHDYDWGKTLRKSGWALAKSLFKTAIREAVDRLSIQSVQWALSHAAGKGMPGAAKAAGGFKTGIFRLGIVSDLAFIVCEWGIPYDARFGYNSGRS